jgi:hypothetical protein
MIHPHFRNPTSEPPAHGVFTQQLPSGKLTQPNITMENYLFFMGKSTISMAMFNSKLFVYQAG